MAIKIEKLTEETFSEFGSLLDPDNCGERLAGADGISYFADTLPLTFSCSSLITLNILKLELRPFEIDFTEAHDDTEELIGGFNEDILFHVGPPTRDPDYSKYRAFILPKNNWARYKKGVWHGGPFAVKEGVVSLGWVLLPPFTYTNDTRGINPDPILKIDSSNI